MTKGGTLRCLNELRLAASGHLRLKGGTVRTRRWVDVRSGGALTGTGRVQGRVYNAGQIHASGLVITEDVYLSKRAALTVNSTRGQANAPLTVKNTLHADGTLTVRLDGDDPEKGDTTTVIDATEIAGQFDEMNLPDLPGDRTWDSTGLHQDGTISVK